MTFDPNSPEDLPPPKIAVDQIRTNFQQYQTAFNANHSALNSSTQGKHTHIIFEEQTNDPEVPGDFDTLYSKSVTSASGTAQQIFARIPQFLPNEFPNIPMQLTFDQVNTTGPDQYQSFMAGGYLVYFGQTSIVPVTITLVPAPTIILSVIANPTNFTAGPGSIPFDVNVTINNASEFTLNSFSATGVYSFKWIAIAKQ
jgi:hypothetical protein